MKLNKKGWSLGREMFYLILFAVCLVIAIIGIVRMNLLFGKMPSADTFNYNALEEKLISASKSYIENKEKIDESGVIKSKKLIEKGYLNSLNDGANAECAGYVITSVTDTISYNAYISCYNYTTQGYSSSKAS